MSYLGKTVPVASIASTQEGRALLEANNVEEQRSLLSVDSTAESDVKLANKQDNLVANDPAVKTALNSTGAAPIYACRAWVNFNGEGVVAIRASGNVSSITDNGVGNYTVNFATAMPDANYNCVCTGSAPTTYSSAVAFDTNDDNVARTTTSLRVLRYYATSFADTLVASVAIFR